MVKKITRSLKMFQNGLKCLFRHSLVYQKSQLRFFKDIVTSLFILIASLSSIIQLTYELEPIRISFSKTHSQFYPVFLRFISLFFAHLFLVTFVIGTSVICCQDSFPLPILYISIFNQQKSQLLHFYIYLRKIAISEYF